MVKKILILGVVIMFGLGLLSACTTKSGELYSLQEAYDQSLLTKEDLKSIAFYLNGNSEDDGYIAQTKEPNILSKKTVKNITETHAYNLKNRSNNPIKDAKAKDVTIVNYYGTYNKCIAVMIQDNYHDNSAEMRKVIIEGTTFNYSDSNNIIIWKKK